MMGCRPRNGAAAGFPLRPLQSHIWAGPPGGQAGPDKEAAGAFQKARGPAPEEAHSALFWSSCSVGRGAKPFNVHKTEAKAGPSQVGEENVSG